MADATRDLIKIVPVKRQTFREQIVAELRSSIISGDLAPGSQIIETDLAARFSVSRGPLREALRQLCEDGLLITVPYTGTYVVDLSLNDILEISSLRIELEVFAFHLVWAKRDNLFLKEMRSRHDALVRAIKRDDGEACISAELALHSFVFEACGHKILLGIWESLKGKLQLYWAAHYRAQGRQTPHIDSHVRYLDLATGNNFETLKAEIPTHILGGFGDTERFVEQYQKSKME